MNKLTFGLGALLALLPTAAHSQMKPVPPPAPVIDDAFLDASIERHRKGDFSVAVPDGVPADAPVSYRLSRHQFEFGTAIATGPLGLQSWKGDTLKNPVAAADVEKYGQTVMRYYNAAVAENAHKWYAMEDGSGFQKTGIALTLWEWCAQREIKMRGHAIYWGVPRWTPQWQKEIPDAQLEARMKRRLNQVVGTFDGKIEEWDLINELLDDDLFAPKLGLPDRDGAAYFGWAKDAAPDFRFYLNEYKGLQTGKVDGYVALIRRLRAANVPIGGIGDQAHYYRPVQPNEQVWAMLEQYGQFGLPVKITEFDLGYAGMTEEAQAADLRRFYRLCFAHPAVAGVYQWGFWEGSHWRKNTALWRKDWTPKPAALAYMKLLDEEWTTRGQTQANAERQINFRGFYGDYEFSAGESKWQARFSKPTAPAP